MSWTLLVANSVTATRRSNVRELEILSGTDEKGFSMKSEGLVNAERLGGE